MKRKLVIVSLLALVLLMVPAGAFSQDNWFWLGARSISGGPVMTSMGTKVTIPSPLGDIGAITIVDLGTGGTAADKGSGSIDFVKFWHIDKLNADIGLNFGPNVAYEEIAPGDVLAYLKASFGLIYHQRLFTIPANPNKVGSRPHIVGIAGSYKRTQRLEDNASTNRSSFGAVVSVSL